MKTLNAIKKVEKFFGEKMNQNANGQYYLNGISFYSKGGVINCLRWGGNSEDSLSNILKRYAK